MPPTSEQGGRRTGAHQFRVLGMAHDVGSIIWDGGREIARTKVHWERLPVVRDRLRKTARNALFETFSWLKTQPELSGDLKAIFGDSLANGYEHPHIEHVQMLGKGWNSLAFSFRSNGQDWVVKLGSFTSPNNRFFPSPATEGHSYELLQNMAIIREGIEKPDEPGKPSTRLPDLLSSHQVVHYTQFRNAGGRRLGRTVHIAPRENIVPLDRVADVVKDNPDIAQELQGQFDRYVNLREWMIREKKSDFDLHGPDNVTIVDTGNSDPRQRYKIRVLDLGLRIHGLNTPVSDFVFDLVGAYHATALRRAIHGKKPHQKGEKWDPWLEDYVADFLAEGFLMAEGTDVRGGIRKDYFVGLMHNLQGFVSGRTYLDGTPRRRSS